MSRFAIIGFGCAGYNALRAIRESGSEAEVDVYSTFPHPPANPMLTTYYVKGKIPYEAMFPYGTAEEILAKYPCNLHSGVGITALDAARRELTLTTGEKKQYDKILIATGANAVNLPVGDIPADRIFTMRTVHDAECLKEALDQRPIHSALVVGASMVGIKIIELLLERGIHAIFSDLAPHIFPTAAYEAVSERIEEYLTGKGVELHFGAKTEEAHLEDGTGVIAMSDGTTVRADIVVMCVGTRADIRWIAQDQLKMNRAIVVDPMMQTSAEGIYAAGDCCEGCDLMLGDTRNIGLYASAYVQGETAGRNMVGIPTRCEGNILHNITHFMEIDFVSFGDKNLPGDRRVLLDRDGQYIEITEQNGHLVCINMLNCYALSGVVKNCILHYFNCHMQPLNREEEGVLAKSGLPNELIQILGGMAE